MKSFYVVSYIREYVVYDYLKILVGFIFNFIFNLYCFVNILKGTFHSHFTSLFRQRSPYPVYLSTLVAIVTA